MLNAMRSRAGGIFAKIMLTLLILSFSVWGIEDMLRSGGRNGALATVGGEEISRIAFDQAYRRELDAMRQQLGKNYSPQLVKMLRPENKVVQDLVAAELIRQETQALGITPSDEDVAREIRVSETFRGAGGKFDKALFTSVLRNNGLSEKAYVETVRRELAARLLLETLTKGARISNAAAAALFEAAGEERSIDVVTLTGGMVGDIPAPDEKQMEAFYAERKDAFAEPETRTVSYVTVGAAQLAKEIAVSEQEIREAYDARAKLFGEGAAPLSEVRGELVQELRKQKIEDAVPAFSAKLEDALAGGEPLKEVAAEYGLKLQTAGPFDQEGNTRSGEKAALPGFANFVESVFKLSEGDDSSLMPARDAEGSFYLVHIDKVTPEQSPPLAQIRDKVADFWRKQEAANRLKEKADKLTAALRDAKDPVALLAREGLTPQPAGRIRRGDPKTSTNLALPGALLQQVFALQAGQATAAHPSQDGTYRVAVLRQRHPTPKIAPAELHKSAAAKPVLDQLELKVRNEMLDMYINHLHVKYDVNVNEAALSAYAGEEQ